MSISRQFPSPRLPPAGRTARGCYRTHDGQVSVRLAPSAGPRVKARLAGSIDYDCATDLRFALHSALAASCPVGLDLDLRGVTFCDCAGLNALLALRERAHVCRMELVICAVSPPVERLLSLTGTRALFDDAPTEHTPHG